MDAVLRTAPTSPTFGSLRFAGSVHTGGGDFKCLATIEADDQTYEVALEMIDAYRKDMLGFFEDLGRMARRGWPDEERWESEFAELRICASSEETGEVRFHVVMRWPPEYDDGWEGTLHFTPEAVEQFAQRMRQFMRMEHGARFRSAGGET